MDSPDQRLTTFRNSDIRVFLTVMKFDIPGLRAPEALKPSRVSSFRTWRRVPRPWSYGPSDESRAIISTLSRDLVKAMGVSLRSLRLLV
jgi:hypothetical protein